MNATATETTRALVLTMTKRMLTDAQDLVTEGMENPTNDTVLTVAKILAMNHLTVALSQGFHKVESSLDCIGTYTS